MGTLNPEFQLECQRRFNWCWAAVSRAVKLYSPPLPSVEQCEVATTVLGNGADCCGDPVSFDIQFSLKEALSRIDKLLVFLNAQVTFEVIKHEIDTRKQPVCARIVWDTDQDGRGDGAHFVVIVGYADSGPTGEPSWLYVKDPDGGEDGVRASVDAEVKEMTFEDFRSRYRLMGKWRQTYLVA